MLAASLWWLLEACSAQSYTSYLSGSAADLAVQPDFGLCLMGGAGENDSAMTWWLQKANGGDVVVLRASGADGYNDYLYSELGVTLNSVETIVFHEAAAATDPYVLEQLAGAEAIWMAGGDQYAYVSHWKDTGVEAAINHLLNVRGGAVGGISAGMAVMAEGYFSAANGTITSEQALADPFAPQLQLGYGDFIAAPYLDGSITETHFNDPDRIRYGRIVAFMARLANDHALARSKGLAANEYCAIAVGADGLARAFGDYPNFEDDYVYFLQSNCAGVETPEVLSPGEALTWNRSEAAIKVYRVPATPEGEHYFDLTTWSSGSGGEWQHWYVDSGALFMIDDAAPLNCVSGVAHRDQPRLLVYPNPASRQVSMSGMDPHATWTVCDLAGRVVAQGSARAVPVVLNTSTWAAGMYTVTVVAADVRYTGILVIQP